MAALLRCFLKKRDRRIVPYMATQSSKTASKTFISAYWERMANSARQGSGADKQRKHDRDKRGIAGNVRTFADQINIQYHFQTEQKDYQRTGNRKRGNVQPEQFQKRFAGIKEEHQQHQRIDKCSGGR